MKKTLFTCKSLLLLLALVIASSCQSGEQIKFKTIGQEQVDLFNSSLQEAKVNSLEELAYLYHPDDPYAEGSKYNYTITTEEEQVNSIITIKEEGLNDDSIEGILIKITVQKEGDRNWKVIKIQEAYRCWKDRGHQDWSAELCL